MADLEQSNDAPAPGTKNPRPSGWLERDVEIGAALFLLALATRIFHLRQIAALDPYFLSPATDGVLYHAWAQEIARGDWLGPVSYTHLTLPTICSV